MKMITLKLIIKETAVELTHVEALKLYNELSLFFNHQSGSIVPQYPYITYDYQNCKTDSDKKVWIGDISPGITSPIQVEAML